MDIFSRDLRLKLAFQLLLKVFHHGVSYCPRSIILNNVLWRLNTRRLSIDNSPIKKLAVPLILGIAGLLIGDIRRDWLKTFDVIADDIISVKLLRKLLVMYNKVIPRKSLHFPCLFWALHYTIVIWRKSSHAFTFFFFLFIRAWVLLSCCRLSAILIVICF